MQAGRGLKALLRHIRRPTVAKNPDYHFTCLMNFEFPQRLCPHCLPLAVISDL